MRLFSIHFEIKNEFYNELAPGPTLIEIDVFARNQKQAQEIAAALFKEPDHYEIMDVVKY